MGMKRETVYTPEGKAVDKLKFDTFAELEAFFIEVMIDGKGVASKVIGTTLLVWQKG